MDNRDTFDYQLSQFGSWYLIAGIDCYLESAMEVCQCDTLLTELERVEQWEREHGAWYESSSAMGFARLRQRILDRKADIEAYESQYYAEQAREQFTVIEGGKKN